MEEESDQEDELRAAAAEDPERRDEGDDGGVSLRISTGMLSASRTRRCRGTSSRCSSVFPLDNVYVRKVKTDLLQLFDQQRRVLVQLCSVLLAAYGLCRVSNVHVRFRTVRSGLSEHGVRLVLQGRGDVLQRLR